MSTGHLDSGSAAPGPASEPPADLDVDADVDADRWIPLDPNWVPAERAAWRLSLSALLTLSLGSLVGVLHSWPQLALVLAVGVLLLACAVYVLAQRYVRRAYALTGWRVTDTELVIRRGVYWRSITTVPRTRIQHTDVNQGPLQRRYSIATLVVHTAGTSEATVTLSGLPHELAHEVRDRLLGAGLGDAV